MESLLLHKESCLNLFAEAQWFTLKINVVMKENESTTLLEVNGRSLCSEWHMCLSIRYVYVADSVKGKEVEIACCSTEVMLANFFTKLLQANLFRKFRAVIFGHVPISSMCQLDSNHSKECVVGCRIR